MMLKSLLGAAAAVSLLGVVACSPATEQASQADQSTYDQSASNTPSDMSQTPQDQTGAMPQDQTTQPGATPSTPPAESSSSSGGTTTPPAPTP